MPGLEPAGSFAAHSFREVTHHVFCSAVIPVPAPVVAKTLKNIESIKRYGADHGVIGCCVMENLMEPTEVGAVRRCTLRLPPYGDRLIREKLTRCTEHRQYADSDAPTSVGSDVTSIELTLDYIPCENSERHRSPFEPLVEEALHRCRTNIRISAVTRTPHRCLVEMDTACVLRLHQGRHLAAEVRLQDKASERAVMQFWQRYLDAQLSALEKTVSKEAFPEVQTRLDADYRRAFADHEQLLCDWSVDSSDTMPRRVAVEELEKVMVWWARALESYKQQKNQTEMAEARAERVDPSPFTLIPPLPRRYTEAERGNAAATTTSPTAKANREAGDAHNMSEMTQSNMDVAMPGFRLPRSFTNMPDSPSAFARSGSRGAATLLSDLSRQSVLLPPDRRYTAMPKKSLASAAAVDEIAAPQRAPSPAASFMVPPSSAASPVVGSGTGAGAAAAPATSTAVQNSMLSYSNRRKQLMMQQPHLLQHAQRRLSNMNNLSNSVSRQSGPASTAGSRAAPNSNATGFFFSQLFATPSYAPTAAATPASGRAAAAAAHSAPTQRSPTAAAAGNGSEPGETFQPEMVRNLFSLTGVLRGDVARRIFYTLCDHDGAAAAPPRLSAQGLKSLLRHLDPCGLREGGSVHRGGAAAALDDAYRAEVQRCYFQQQATSAPTTKSHSAKASKKDSADAAAAAVAVATDREASSTLSRLAARREATLRESDDVALDKLVQSLMSRFAFQRKQELNCEEFQLALQYLWNT